MAKKGEELAPKYDKKGNPTTGAPLPLCKPEKTDKGGSLPGTTSKPSSKEWEKHK